MSRGPLAGAKEWVLAVRALWRLQRRARPPAPAGPGAAPRPAAVRPDDDPALRARLGRWSRRAGATGADPGPGLGAADAAEAARTLLALRAQMTGAAAEAIDAHMEAGSIDARRLRPADGYVWEMPGMRVFAIVGVQAFTVDDAR